MKVINDIIEQSIDRLVEKKVGERIEQNINSIVDKAIKEEIEKQIKDKIGNAIKANSQNLDACLKEMNSLDKTMETYVKKYTNEVVDKLKTACEKLDIKVDISAANQQVNNKLANAFYSYVCSYSETFGRILAGQLKAYLEKTSFFTTAKG